MEASPAAGGGHFPASLPGGGSRTAPHRSATRQQLTGAAQYHRHTSSIEDGRIPRAAKSDRARRNGPTEASRTLRLRTGRHRGDTRRRAGKWRTSADTGTAQVTSDVSPHGLAGASEQEIQTRRQPLEAIPAERLLSRPLHAGHPTRRTAAPTCSVTSSASVNSRPNKNTASTGHAPVSGDGAGQSPALVALSHVLGSGHTTGLLGHHLTPGLMVPAGQLQRPAEPA